MSRATIVCRQTAELQFCSIRWCPRTAVPITYLVHASAHVLVGLTHGDLLAERTNCRGKSTLAATRSITCTFNGTESLGRILFFFFLVFLLLRPFSCSSRIRSSAIWEESALLRVDINQAYRNSDRYLQSTTDSHKPKGTQRETSSLCVCVLSPVNVIILMHAVQLQFKATEQVLDHDPQIMVEDPGTQAS